LIAIPISTPDLSCITGTFGGTLSSEWDAIDDFNGNLFPLLVRYANMNKLALDPTDIASGVEATMLSSYMGALMNLQWLQVIMNLGADSRDPIFLDLSQYVFRRRAHLARTRDRAATYPFPPLYRDWVDYLMQPVTIGPGSPILMGVNNWTRTQRQLGSTSVVDTILDGVDTTLDALENSADKQKFLNALQSFKPQWATPLKDLHAVVDPERVLMWRTRAVRNTNGVTDRQSPNIEDSGWGNGTRVPFITMGSPHPFQFTGLVPSITYEKDDKGSGDASYGSVQLRGDASDDSDLPSELDYVYGRATASWANEPLDYDQSVSNVGTKIWPQFIFSARAWSDDPADYFAENIFDNMKYYEWDIDEVAVETRRLLVEAWQLNLG
jgi:hypothetical protein